jgi:G3E family GTPase
MRVPITVVTGVRPEATALATVALQWDLPRAVVVRHRIDREEEVLRRVVSDATGVLERADVPLAHTCVSCAVREDVLPTLRRVAQDGRWGSVVALPPVGTPPELIVRALAGERELSRRLRDAGTVVAVDGATLVDDLVGDALLADQGLHAAPDDRRGVAEVLGRMIEYADAAVLTSPSEAAGRGLVRTLARPGAVLLDDAASLGAALVDTLGDRVAREEWVAVDRRQPLPPVPGPEVWRVDLRADRPFHPARLLENIGLIGGGRHRSRGCFWLPRRPDRVGEWDGAGGQLSIGTGSRWRRPSHTRIVVVGTGSPPGGLEDAFESMLVSRRELRTRGSVWEQLEDGLEPWLGPIDHAA